MPASFEFNGKICVHKLARQSVTDYTATEAKDIGVVVQSCVFCGISIAAARSAYASYLICCKRDAYPRTADEESSLTLAVDYLV